MSGDRESPMSGDIVSATIDEVRSDRNLDPARVRKRLIDWQKRVHELFNFIEKALGGEFTYDRSANQRSREEMVQRAGLQENEVPKLDVLRIEKPPGTLRALIVPRGLWVIGANGRLDLRVLAPKPQLYLIVDRSEPLIGRADWFLIPAADRLTPRPLTQQLLREVTGADS
jgi:hypothetical protein